ncbi:MAG: hypothetical protein KF857_13010 [Fimbriimonadaceae bacterium]|nr:hypothetical protein [Fimbriimonadaceae bacterium]
MKKFPGGKIALALLALMGLSFVLLVFAKEEPRTSPTIESTYPSGLAAFAELLRRDGYQVVLDKRPRPRFTAGDLVVSVDMPTAEDIFGQGTHDDMTKQAIDTYLGEGGAELVLGLSNEFDSASRQMTLVELAPLAGMAPKKLTYEKSALYGPTYRSAFADAHWKFPRQITVPEAIGATNRFIGQGQNAEVMLGYVHMLAEPGSRVVFPEALIGNAQDQGPLDTLGSWAVAGRTQAYILLTVVVLTLAVRFGSPSQNIVRQRSARDMLDAVAELLRRSGKTQFALEVALEDAYERFRLGVGAPHGTTRDNLRERMPQPLLNAVTKAEALASLHLDDDSRRARAKTMPMARELDDRVTDFEKDTRLKREPLN